MSPSLVCVLYRELFSSNHSPQGATSPERERESSPFRGKCIGTGLTLFFLFFQRVTNQSFDEHFLGNFHPFFLSVQFFTQLQSKLDCCARSLRSDQRTRYDHRLVRNCVGEHVSKLGDRITSRRYHLSDQPMISQCHGRSCTKQGRGGGRGGRGFVMRSKTKRTIRNNQCLHNESNNNIWVILLHYPPAPFFFHVFQREYVPAQMAPYNFPAVCCRFNRLINSVESRKCSAPGIPPGKAIKSHS